MKTSEMKSELLMHRLRHDGVHCHYDHAAQFRRSAMRLHRWHEMECNGDVSVDDDTGIAYRHYGSDRDPMQTVKTANIGEIEESKIAALCSGLGCHYYIQGDPRGAALYVSGTPISNNGNRGVCCDLD